MIYTGVGIILFAISLFFEEGRDFWEGVLEFILEFLEDSLGDFGEGIIYIISFEWIGDIPEFFESMFEDITDFSTYGLAFGLLSLILIYFTRSYMIEPFVQFYKPMARIFWTIATYVTVFVGGYLLGKHFENT